MLVVSFVTSLISEWLLVSRCCGLGICGFLQGERPACTALLCFMLPFWGRCVSACLSSDSVLLSELLSADLPLSTLNVMCRALAVKGALTLQ